MLQNLIGFISLREGGKLIWMGFNHHLSKEAVMAMKKIKKDGSWTWGGWIHAFWCLEWASSGGEAVSDRPAMVYRRYDAYND